MRISILPWRQTAPRERHGADQRDNASLDDLAAFNEITKSIASRANVNLTHVPQQTPRLWRDPAGFGG
jgi:hypothetical protein